MNKQELIAAEIAQSADISKKAADEALQGFMRAVSDTMKKDGKLKLTGFVSFSVVRKAARTSRHPQTGKEMKIPATKVVKFNPGSKLAEAVMD